MPNMNCPPGTCAACDIDRLEQLTGPIPMAIKRVLAAAMREDSERQQIKKPEPADGWAAMEAAIIIKDRAPTEETKDMSNENYEQQIRDVGIERKGSKILVPKELPLQAAVVALQRKITDEEKSVDFSHVIDVAASEGAVAFLRVLEREFGFVSAVSSPGFFGPQPPYFMGIDVAPGEQVQVPWCECVVPGIEGKLSPGHAVQMGQVVFQISGSVKGKDRPKVERVVQLIREECKNLSIYKGHAIAVAFPPVKDLKSLEDTFPKFQSLNPVKPEDLVFSRELTDQVDVSLFTPIRRTAECRKHNIPLKRGVLMEGPYGVGKTMTAAATATLCKENGWTYIYLRDAKELAKAYAFAAKYQPAVIFAEDIDQVLEGAGGRDEKVNNILNALDGIDSKGVEIITVLTTNNIDDITRALLRPGRLDTVISMRAPDEGAAMGMIRKFAGDLLDPASDLTECGELLKGVIPAIIREVVERSKLAAMRRVGDSGELVIRAEDVAVTARSMKSHMDLLKEEPHDDRSRAEKAASIVAEGLVQHAKITHGKSNGASAAITAAARHSVSADAE